MKIKLLTVCLAAFGFSFAATAATAAMDDLIVCSGGVYCEDVRLECLASGQSQTLCNRQWRGCVLDACPQ
ncbi:hypothetical protein D187_010092 [Cystobacter fuscus DSM 2262]|uniref:Lipoprotein n=1 Tax=Cystobacter fuscus (strain ATCC 25194 / DSM 2262 / NBRC 100088 / M29) TaxID=1242864 RepID=S9QZW0_CYSF2|nr:hypothetical protein [Cystobacter fuscus]EPX62188.1 hypothetical protein D187_010092 [Cystobacter fuscus DSM 2262]